MLRRSQRLHRLAEDGATVDNLFRVSMEASGFTSEPAGDVREDAGRFHLMVDASCVAPGEEIPQDAGHLHLGDGATETELDLPAGEHTLCLQAGDGPHTALDLTDQITITVVEPCGTAPGTETEETTGAEVWEGTYTGTVVWDCGPIGERQGTLDGIYTIRVNPSGTATIGGHAPRDGVLRGRRRGHPRHPHHGDGQENAVGLRVSVDLRDLGTSGPLTITVAGDRGTGTLTGPAPGPATVTLTFEVECRSC